MQPFHSPKMPSVLNVSLTASPICDVLILCDCILVRISSRGDTNVTANVRPMLPAMAGM